MNDIYFNRGYGKLYEKIDGGKCSTFVFEDNGTVISNTYMMRAIDLDKEKTYYDIITPYGYGGPHLEKGSLDSCVIKKYMNAWKKFCSDNDIVSEFIRFHPIERNWGGYEAHLNASYCRHTVAIKTDDADFFMRQFTSQCRNKIKKAEKNGVVVSIDKCGESIDNFISLYERTMQKNDASDYYYFGKEYFYELLDTFKEQSIIFNAFYGEKLVCSSIILKCGKYLHYHLTANDPDFYKLAANNLLLYEVAKYGYDNGFTWLHLGGGYSNSEDDPLFTYKRSFGRLNENLFDFYIGKNIYNKEAYEHLVEIRAQTSQGCLESEYFPQYRA